MKMRNEVASPATGIVRGLAVQAGSNVRAREPMLWIVAA
jgi:biotin carboxyl carrier protein